MGGKGRSSSKSAWTGSWHETDRRQWGGKRKYDHWKPEQNDNPSKGVIARVLSCFTFDDVTLHGRLGVELRMLPVVKCGCLAVPGEVPIMTRDS